MKYCVRITVAAWQVLQRVDELEAEIALCSDRLCNRFHIVSGGVTGEVLRTATVEALVAAGLLRRGRGAAPTYHISEKGLSALRQRERLRVWQEMDVHACTGLAAQL